MMNGKIYDQREDLYKSDEGNYILDTQPAPESKLRHLGRAIPLFQLLGWQGAISKFIVFLKSLEFVVGVCFMFVGLALLVYYDSSARPIRQIAVGVVLCIIGIMMGIGVGSHV